MSTPEARRPHENWRLTRADGTAVTLKFQAGVTLEDLRLLHPRFIAYEPVRAQANGQIGHCVDGAET